MSNGSLFIMQLVGIVGIGGFIGELQRAVHAGADTTPLVFVSNFLAGSFLSFLVAYAIYQLINSKPTSLIIGGLLSYQEQSYITSISQRILEHILEEVKDE